MTKIDKILEGNPMLVLEHGDRTTPAKLSLVVDGSRLRLKEGENPFADRVRTVSPENFESLYKRAVNSVEKLEGKNASLDDALNRLSE